MATYGGNNIFGRSVQMETAINPSDNQIASFFGISGLESQWAGARGKFTMVKGVFRGDDLADLATQINTFATYKDGIARPLVDTDGLTYPWCVLDSFGLVGRRYGTTRSYQARFIHLT